MIIAACVWSHAERDVTAELRRAGFRAYYPQETLDRVIMGRKRRLSRPAFSGYVFVEVEPDRLSEIHVKGVFDIVRGTSSDPRPAIIPPEQLACIFLAELFGELDYTRQPEAWRPGLGERVRVKNGKKFAGYLGRVLSLSKQKARVELDRGGRMEVRQEELEAAA